MIRARITGIGLMGPGLPNWEEGRKVLDGTVPHESAVVEPPRPQVLSARERRRTSHGVRLALAVAQEAVDNTAVDPKSLPTIFGWAHGDGPVMQRLLETLATPERYVSPTDFHNSVHNVAVGYWTIASGSHQPCSSMAAGIDTFPASLLKALTEVECEARPVLLISCGMPFPEPLNSVCPVGGSFGVALVLTPPTQAGGLAEIAASYVADATAVVTEPDTRALHELWSLNAAAHALPLLESVARKREREISIPYGPKGRLKLAVSPC